MSMHNSHDNKPDDREQTAQERQQPDTSAGYERSDVKARGILVFIFAMGVLAVVTAVICFQIGKVLFAHMAKEDGPKSKWTTTTDVRSLGNMANNPDLQSKTGAVVQQFPTPQLQTDDGSQDLVNLHAKEDLLLENYSWIDQSQGKVRIPIERAMELVAQSGLPVASQAEDTPLMIGDSKPMVTAPLTNGFARTGYELEAAQTTATKNKTAESKK
jgi:hypothetical protein